jgi:3-oxoacyl-[acyl-carrier-protein] synthase-3
LQKAYIKDIEYYFPPHKVSNQDLATEFKINHSDIFTKTGVKNRYKTSTGIIGSDLGFEAAKILLSKMNKQEINEIDCILFCTEGLDYKAPTTACILQNRLQLSKKTTSIDIPMGCTGFINGLLLAQSLIVSGNAQNILFITAEIASTVTNPKNLELRSLFSDAGCATLISGTTGNKGIRKFITGTDGSGFENLIVYRSCTRNPADLKWIEDHHDAQGMLLGQMEMNSKEIFLFAYRTVPQLIEDTLNKNNCSFEQIDLFIFHQANGPMNEALRKKFKIPESKFFCNIEYVGNTVSNSIPIAIKQAIAEGKIKPNTKVLIAGFGIGYSWGATIIDF